jgi:hypothetical protein
MSLLQLDLVSAQIMSNGVASSAFFSSSSSLSSLPQSPEHHKIQANITRSELLLPPYLAIVREGDLSKIRLPIRAAIVDNKTLLEEQMDGLSPFGIDEWYLSAKFQIENKDEKIVQNPSTIEHLLIGRITSFDSLEDLLESAILFESLPMNEIVVLPLMDKGASFMIAEVQFNNRVSGVYFELFDKNQLHDKPSIEDFLQSRESEGIKREMIFAPISGNEIAKDIAFLQISSSIICKEINSFGYRICKTN